MAKTTIQQTKRKLKREGWKPQTVEQWNAFSQKRSDLLGIIDLLAFKLGEPILAVQCTAVTNFADHMRKICQDCAEDAMLWLSTGNRLELWGWHSDGSGRLRREEIFPADISPPEEIVRQRRNAALLRAIELERG